MAESLQDKLARLRKISKLIPGSSNIAGISTVQQALEKKIKNPLPNFPVVPKSQISAPGPSVQVKDPSFKIPDKVAGVLAQNRGPVQRPQLPQIPQSRQRNTPYQVPAPVNMAIQQYLNKVKTEGVKAKDAPIQAPRVQRAMDVSNLYKGQQEARSKADAPLAMMKLQEKKQQAIDANKRAMENMGLKFKPSDEKRVIKKFQAENQEEFGDINRMLLPEKETQLKQDTLDRPYEKAAQFMINYPKQIAEKESWIKKHVALPSGSLLKSENGIPVEKSLDDIAQEYPDIVKRATEDYEKAKRVSAFLGTVAGAFDESITTFLGEDAVKEGEVSYAISPERTIPQLLESLTLDIIPFKDIQNMGSDVYFKDGLMYYRGFAIDNEFLTKEGAQAAAGADLTATILGSIPTYMGIAGGIKKGVGLAAKTNKFFKDVQKVTKNYPVLSEVLGYNVAEETAEAIIRQGTGQDYSFNQFLNGILLGGTIGGTIQIAGKAFSKAEVEKALDEAEQVIKDTGNVDMAQDVMVGKGKTFGDLFGEQRYAYLKQPNKGRPGIEEPDKLPFKEETIDSLESDMIKEYKKAGDDPENPGFSKADRALYEVFSELDSSFPKQVSRDATTGDYINTGSTFPDWVPSDLRKTALFKKMFSRISSIDDLSYPKNRGLKERELFDFILDQVDRRTGVDTSAIRNNITQLYDRRGKTGVPKASDSSVKGSPGIRRIKVGEGEIPDVNYSPQSALKAIEKAKVTKQKPPTLRVVNIEDVNPKTYKAEGDVNPPDFLFPAQVQNKAILGAKAPKQTPPTLRVTDMSNYKPLEAPLNKLPKNRNIIKGMEPGFPLADTVKVKRGGLTTILRDEVELLKSMVDLKAARFGRILKNPIRVFEKLGDDFKEMFYRPVKEAEGAYTREIKNTTERIEELEKATRKVDKNASKRIMLYALSQETDGRRILKILNKQAPILKEAEMNAYKQMRSEYDKFLDRLNVARAHAGKKPIQKRDNYFTHIRQMDALESLGWDLGKVDVDTMINKGVHKNSTTFRFDISRKGAADIEMDAFNVFKKYANSATKYIHYTPVLSKLRELVGTKITDPATGEVFQMIDHAPNAHAYITKWLDFVAGQKWKMPPALESAANKLSRNMAYSTLSFNLQSALIQPTAILNTAVEIGPQWAVKGILDLMDGKGLEALKKSNVLEGRTFDVNIKDAAQSKATKIQQSIAEVGLRPLQELDAITAKATWLGAYAKKLKETGSERVAINYADDVVTKTQASASAADLAPIQRTAAGKVITQFQTFVVNNFDWLATDVFGIGNANITKAEVAKKTLTYLVGATMLNTLYEDVLGLPSPLPRPIEAYKNKGLKEAVDEVASLLPIIGGNVKYGGALGGPIFDIGDQWLKKRKGEYTRNSRAELLARGLGLPGLSQVSKTLKGAGALGPEGYDVYDFDPLKKKGNVNIEGLDAIRALLFGPRQTKAAKEKLNEKKEKIPLTF